MELMRDTDELGLIDFDARVAPLHPVARLTREARLALHAHIEAITPGRGTALEGAIETAVDMARSDGARAHGHVLLVTDGRPSIGGTTRSDLESALERGGSLSTLSTIGFGDAIDVAVMSRVADAGLGRFSHLGEHDVVTDELCAELTVAARTCSEPVRVVVQLRPGALVRSHRGPHILPPLIDGRPAVHAFEIEVPAGLELGRSQLGLVTVRARCVDGRELVREVVLDVDVGEDLGKPDADVIRARLLRDARTAMCRVADADDMPAVLVEHLLTTAARIEGHAAASGLEQDRPIASACVFLRATADDLEHAP